MTGLPPELERCLECPLCRGSLAVNLEHVLCAACGMTYPIAEGTPILLLKGTSIFSAEEATQRDRYIFSRPIGGRLRSQLRRWLPASATNLYAESAFRTIRQRLAQAGSANPSVLVLGAGQGGAALSVLLAIPNAHFIQSDVVLGPEVAVVLDAHDIPFSDDTFDVVVLQAVLEHVLDPKRCVSEAWRVLKPRGLIYVETPFMQQVHGGRYDFTRYTFLGHRQLLRAFAEIDSGIVAGPGAALAWAWEYFLMSFCRSSRTRLLARILGRGTSFFLKYFDPMLLHRPGSYDAASAFGFLGFKAPAGEELPNGALLASYPGMIR